MNLKYITAVHVDLSDVTQGQGTAVCAHHPVDTHSTGLSSRHAESAVNASV
jgi:putative NIF3 family GTP cyclohydrolase 1 type 2